MNRESSFIRVYTDGASSGNPGPSGWGSVIVFPHAEVIELGQHELESTNNRMELIAAIESLSYIQSLSQTIRNILIYSDSQYVILGMTRWIFTWRRAGWKTANKKPVANRDLWLQLCCPQFEALQIQWKHVPGHKGIVGNERADAIAVAFSLRQDPKLYRGPIQGYPHPQFEHPEPDSPF